MNTIRLLSLVLAAVAAAVLVTGSFGASSIDADRSVEIQTVSDDRAYVGYEQAPEDVFFGTFDDLIVTKSGHEEAVVEVTNRFPVAFNVTSVEADTHRVHLREPDRPPGIEPGERATIHAELRCEDAFLVTKEHVGVSVAVEGENVQAELDGDTIQREATVVCFNFPGHGFKLWHTGGQRASTNTASVGTSAPTARGPVEATVWIKNTLNGTIERIPGHWDTAAARAQQFDPHLGNGLEIVAVSLEEHGVAFARPGWQAQVAGASGIDGFDIERHLDEPGLAGFEPDR